MLRKWFKRKEKLFIVKIYQYDNKCIVDMIVSEKNKKLAIQKALKLSLYNPSDKMIFIVNRM